MADYVTIADVRAEGVQPNINDAKILTSIKTWQALIERATRQFFDKRTLTLDLDGNDSSTLFLPVPVISVSKLFINDDFVNSVLTTAFRVYSRRGPVEDDRPNPKIRLIRTGNLFEQPFDRGLASVFLKGQLNIRITGDFGYTEADDSTPELIKRALLKLVIKDVDAQGNDGLANIVIESESIPAGNIISETTDGHSISYGGNKTFKSDRVGLGVITEDPEVNKIIELYRAPLAISVPGSFTWFQG